VTLTACYLVAGNIVEAKKRERFMGEINGRQEQPSDKTARQRGKRRAGPRRKTIILKGVREERTGPP